MVENEFKIDKKNKKLLFALEQNSRQPLQQMAKKVGLSKEAVFHRMKSLESEGVVKKYLTEINAYKLGYQYFPVLLKLQNITPTEEKKIINYLKTSNYVAWLAMCEGNWDINLTVLAKNNFDLNMFLSEFLERFSKYLAEKQIHTTTEIHYFKRGFWLRKPTTQTISTGGDEAVRLDKQDLELLNILSENARKPLVEIAKRLKTSAKSVAYRIKKLEKQKVIQGSRVLVDFSKLNYKFYKIWFSLRNMSENNWKKLFSYFQINPNIIWATKLIGSYDLSIEMEVKDVTEFRRIISEIKEEFSYLIKKHESLLIFEEVVMNYLPRV